MKGVTIPCLYLDGEAMKLKGLDIEVPLNQIEAKDITFFNVAGISTYEEDGEEFSEIFCNGEFFVSRVPFKEVVKLFEDL